MFTSIDSFRCFVLENEHPCSFSKVVVTWFWLAIVYKKRETRLTLVRPDRHTFDGDGDDCGDLYTRIVLLSCPVNCQR